MMLEAVAGVFGWGETAVGQAHFSFHPKTQVILVGLCGEFGVGTAVRIVKQSQIECETAVHFYHVLQFNLN